MKIKKRTNLFSVFLTLLVFISSVIVLTPASKAETVSGYCGETAFWNFNPSIGELYIYGSGETDNWFDSESGLRDTVDISSVKKITIGPDIESINCLQFSAYTFLSEIKVQSGSRYFFSDSEGVLYSNDQTILYCYPKANSASHFTVPSPVKKINDYAFSHCTNLQDIILPDRLEEIGDDAFSFCTDLKSISLPDSVVKIGKNVFYMTDIEEINIPATVTRIGDSLSSMGKLKKITVDPANETFCSDENGILYSKNKSRILCFPCGNKTTVFSVPDGVHTISMNAFLQSDIEEITIPATVKYIEGYLSSLSDLKKITVDPANETFCSDENGILYSKDKEILFRYPPELEYLSYTVPDGVKVIGYRAFSYCDNLVCLTLPEGVEEIREEAFSSFPGQASAPGGISIPSSVKKISDHAFYFTYHVNIYYPGTQADWDLIEIVPHDKYVKPPYKLDLHDSVTIFCEKEMPAETLIKNAEQVRALEEAEKTALSQPSQNDNTPKNQTLADLIALTGFACIGLIVGLVVVMKISKKKDKDSQ